MWQSVPVKTHVGLFGRLDRASRNLVSTLKLASFSQEMTVIRPTSAFFETGSDVTMLEIV